MEPFAEPADIEAVWRELTDDESAIAAGLIDQASANLRAMVPTIDAQIASSTNGLKAALARNAVVNAVKRVLINPEGWLQDSFTLDDYSRDRRRDAALSTGANYIDPADLVGLIASASRKWGMIKLRATL